MIMNPRRLPECMLSLENVDAPKVWIRNYTEKQLEQVIPRVIEESDFDYYIAVSDDVIAWTGAYDSVRRALEEEKYVVATGYCNLDPFCGMTSLTKSPPREPYATEQCYDWISFRDLPDRKFIRTYHPSFAMTGMSRAMWAKYPWRCWGSSGVHGWAADLDLGVRLAADGVPIFAPRDAFIYHTKMDWREVDHQVHVERKLYVGLEPAEIVWDL